MGAGVGPGLGSELGTFKNPVSVPGLLSSSCYVPMEHQEFGVRFGAMKLWSELPLSAEYFPFSEN